MISTEQVRKLSIDDLPSRMGVVINHVGPRAVRSELAVKPWLLAPNTFLHAGAVIVLADVSAGYGCIANLPAGAVGFTTVELKSNHVGTARDGTIECVAKAMHLGRTTQVWDAIVTHRESGKTVALFRCTQMVLYAESGAGSPSRGHA
jgi:1,4-dihydroxy-2-naphthoyl-CoA hydrolase